MSAVEKRTTGQFGRFYPHDEAWHAKAQPEAPIAPDIEIVDAHHHLWDREDHRYLPDDFIRDATGNNITATVYVEARSSYRASGPEEMKPVGEVEFATRVCEASRRDGTGVDVGAAVVGFADLTLGDWVCPVLEAEIVAGKGRFRGVRHSAGWHPDPSIGNSHVCKGPHLYLDPEFRRGVQCLTKLGLVLDAWLFFNHLDDVAELAEALPDASIVLCHTGGPLAYGPHKNAVAEMRGEWLRSMKRIAGQPNVSVKLGGLVSRLAAYDYFTLPVPPTSTELASFWEPYIVPTIELFGPDRCMFESNFPADKVGVGFTPLWNAYKRLAAGATPSETQALFNGTARRTYRIGHHLNAPTL